MQVARSNMSDLEWEFIKAVLPNKTRGKKRVDDRRVINGIFYVLRTGIPWADLPEQYGPPTTVYNRFNRWSYAGHWDRIMDAIADAHNVDMVMVDGTSVRAHHSATTLKKDPRRCLGRSRGGLERFQFSLKQGYRQCPESAEGVAGYWRSNINWKRFRHENTCTYQSGWAADPI